MRPNVGSNAAGDWGGFSSRALIVTVVAVGLSAAAAYSVYRVVAGGTQHREIQEGMHFRILRHLFRCIGETF